MRIAICDDVEKELKNISAALESYAKSHPDVHFDVDEYDRAVDILSAVEDGKSYEIALLDICMPGILGTDIAKKMLSQSPHTCVIFVTTSNEYAVTAFALNAVHYLLKPFSQEQFETAIDRAIQKIGEQDFCSFHCVDGIYRVRRGEIVFIESQGHYLSVCLTSGKSLRLRSTLSQIFAEMQEYPGFIRVGASYVANLDFVRKISAASMEMINGVRIPVPRRSAGAVRKSYMDFCRKEALK